MWFQGERNNPSGYLPAQRKSFRIERAMKCDAIDLSDNQICTDRALNALYSGHDGVGRPYITYLCDRHDSERPNG